MKFFRTTRNGLIAFIVLALMSLTALVSPAAADSSSTTTSQPDIICCGGGNPSWGWDSYGYSTSLTSSSLSNLISELHGKPAVVGVYLDHGTSTLLNSTVVSALHNDGIGIDLIEDSYTTAEQNSGGLVTSAEGAADATTAATRAHNLGAPENDSVVIYRDIEQGEYVTSAYITGYFNQLGNYNFIPGFYENPTSGYFSSAFCTTNSTIETGSAQWASVPEETPTSITQFYDGNQPSWNPSNPYCTSSGASVYAWQYIEAGGVGPVDDDLMASSGAW